MSSSCSGFCGSTEGGPYLSLLQVFLKCRLLFRDAFICPFSPMFVYLLLQMWGEVLYGEIGLELNMLG